MSVIAGVDFSQTSVICFCWGFSCCPYYRGVRYSGVSARRELTVSLFIFVFQSETPSIEIVILNKLVVVVVDYDCHSISIVMLFSDQYNVPIIQLSMLILQMTGIQKGGKMSLHCDLPLANIDIL